MIGTLLIVLLILLIIGAIPNLGLHGYGYGPSGLLGVVLVVLLILILLGKI
jgi:hypothetical protein